MTRITNYDSLVQAVLDFSHRSDLKYAVDYFIQFAEARIVRDIFSQNFGAGIRAMEKAFTPAAIDGTTGYLPVPTDYLSLKNMQAIDGSGGVNTLDYKDVEWMYDNYPLRSGGGFPATVAREGTNFIFGPFPDAAYTVQGTYYYQATLIGATSETTWMVTDAPDLILSACMIEVGPFMKDPDLISMFQGMYTAKLAGVISKDMADKWSNATMQVSLG